MQWSAKLFSVRGIDVRVHLTFALIVALGATQWGGAHGARGAAFGAFFMLALFGCVLLHELGHSLMAQAFGLKVKEIVLLPIGGIATLLGKPKTAGQEVAIAAAGPAVNIALAGCFAGALWVRGYAFPQDELKLALAPSADTLLLLLATGNASLALFNLLPFFPLDGGRILRALLSWKLGGERATRWAASIGQVAAVGMLGWSVYSGQLLLGLIALMLFAAASREKLSAQLERPLAALSAGDLAELPAVELSATNRVSEAVPFLLRSSQQAFPIVRDNSIVGVVLREDLLSLSHREDARLLPMHAIMQPAPQIASHVSVEEALQQLHASGQTVGVVLGPEHPLGLLSARHVLVTLAEASHINRHTNTKSGLRPAAKTSSSHDAA